ncbi:hypothetical protein AKUH1B302M_00600 [Apilactobacillus kunkeei]|nr:hypothetical protein AKUH1B302M_00600 [Apilactobacillus kunkeei]
MYNRQEQKQEAKSLLRENQRFFFILFLPFLLIEIASSIVNSQSRLNDILSTEGSIKLSNTDILTTSASIIVFSILAGIFLMGAFYTVFNVLRGKTDFQNPLRKSLTFIDNQRLFWGTVWVFILKIIILGLWLIVPSIVFGILFLVPVVGALIGSIGIIATSVFLIIKTLAYSQALWIYRDAFLENKPVSAYEAITLSNKMMYGYKSDMFVLQLSFIGWNILVAITYGIVGLYVYPYYYITLAKFYEFVKEQYKQDNTVLDVE